MPSNFLKFAIVLTSDVYAMLRGFMMEKNEFLAILKGS